ncbi:hypothetical protein C0995_005180 [Termitomyces sp. Mi166|nr:hypothetical protein C0995_005180 [Termitomyces sp. Mi166\
MRTLFSVVAFTSLLPGSLGRVFNIFNNCPQSINIYISGKSQGKVMTGTTLVRNLAKNWSGSIYTDANGGYPDGSNGTKAGFYGKDNYYYIVDEARLNTGLRITPDAPVKNGFCQPAMCDNKACNSAIYHVDPTTFPPPSSTPPEAPLYSCPGSEVGYQVTGGFPSPKNSPPVAIHPNGDKSKCLDVRGGVFVNGTAIQIYDCNGSKGQQWLISAAFTLISLFEISAYNVDARSAYPKNGDKVELWIYSDSRLPFQSWLYTEDKRLRLYATAKLVYRGQCLDLPNGSTANGNQLQIWDCIQGNKNQIWTFS